MMSPLFRINVESNTSPLIVFLALNAFLYFILSVIQAAPGPDSHIQLRSGFIFIVFWLMAFCMVAGGLGLLRHNREKRTRLFAQLPVSNIHVRLAYWGLAAVFIFISTFGLTMIMILSDAIPPTQVLQFSLLYFFHAGVLLAVISIIYSNNIRIIPEEIRQRTVIYFLMATFLTFLTMFVIGWLMAGYIYVLEGGTVNWMLLTVATTIACCGLVSLDIYLFGRKENYLG